MNPQINPYSPPQSGVSIASEPLEVVPAGRWRRFWSYSIDCIAFFFLAALLGAIIAVVGGDEVARQLEGVPDFLISLALQVGYFAFFEGTVGRTLGKWLMGTKVVNEFGNRPRFGQVLGRTLARLIPFEALAIFGNEGCTVHDSITRTYVVKCR